MRKLLGDCQIICVRDFREGGFRFVVSIENAASEAWSAKFAWLQRAVKPQGRVVACRRRGARRRSCGPSDGCLAMMPVAMIIALFLENAHRTGWQTGP